jgi:hypothetical protein
LDRLMLQGDVVGGGQAGLEETAHALYAKCRTVPQAETRKDAISAVKQCRRLVWFCHRRRQPGMTSVNSFF